MPKRLIITCVTPEVRELLMDSTDDRAIANALSDLPSCSKDQVELEASGGRGEKKKRAPSKYNIFVGECLKTRPKGTPVTEFMATCAVRWKDQKARSR